MDKRVLLRTIAAVVIAAPTCAMAGIVDDPIPTIDNGSGARMLYIVPNVIKNNGLETMFTCTSAEKSAAVVAVEVYDTDGTGPLNDVSVGSSDGKADVPAGGTVTIGTGSTTAISETDIITGLPANVRGGAARIIATGKRIFCSAVVIEEGDSLALDPPPPTVAFSLKVINRKKQNGD